MTLPASAKRGLARFLAFTCLSMSTFSAPLFPDVSSDHWAKDAVASLAAKGLVEGYPDGTFKGDRSASRWEVAMVVARLLAKMEQEQATFATKAELDEVRKLAAALRDELDALGVRTSQLEESVSRLDRRVTELERITFYGSLDTRVVMQSFKNDGALDNDAGRGGTGAAGGVPYLAYGNMVGTRTPTAWRPSVQGVMPVVDYRIGRALSSGTGFTSLAILGLNVKVSPDIDAGAEFAAFSAQGDSVVDAYWGISAPYLQNAFTANAGPAQSLDNTPYTRMVLNKFWAAHKPSGVRLTVGTIDKTRMSPLVYSGAPNLAAFGPARWPGYGFDLTGSHKVGDSEGTISWEILGSKFGHGVRFQGQSYENYVLAGNVGYQFSRGEAQLNFARWAEEAPSGGGNALVVGLTNGQNVAYGASSGWTLRQWVNPPGYFANQRSTVEQNQTATFPNTADTRPITGWNPTADNAVGMAAGGGNYGPQSQDTYGLNARYDVINNEDTRLFAGVDYAFSDYRPSRNSSYSTRGDALRAELGAEIKPWNLALNLEYLSIDPNYSPSAWFGNVTGLRSVKTFTFVGAGHLFDNAKYPINREGFRAKASWRFDDGAGQLYGNISLLDQQRTSLYDVRVLANALGAGTPTGAVLGFAPGFVDPIFYGYASPLQYGAKSGNSFDASLNPLEDQRGSENLYALGGSYKWTDLGLKLTGGYQRLNLKRDSGLSAALGGSQNLVDIKVDSWNAEAAYDLSKKWTINAGLDYVKSAGHYDPAGLYNSYALATGSTNFSNLDSDQFIPHLGLDWAVSDKSTWSILARRYVTEDHVDSAITPGVSELGQIGSTQHPFNWSGWQVSSEFKLTF